METVKNIFSLRKNIDFFTEKDIEAAIRMGVTLGHGSVLTHETVTGRYSPIGGV